MIDIAKLKYKLILVTSDGQQRDISAAANDLGWEEGEGELAMRISCSLATPEINGSRLSSLAVPGALLVVIADWGSGSDEVARGTINDWDPSYTGAADSFDLTAYDDLYCFQRSQDNRYYAAGTGTKAAILALFSDWGIPLDTYSGPDVAHAKTLFKAQYLGDIVYQLLEDAEKKGGIKSIVRSVKGRVQVIPEGSNSTIYHFSDDNATLARNSLSIADLVTRVKVCGKEDSEGRQPIEAVLDGKTQFGIRQRLYDRDEDDSLADATKAAQEILATEGEPSKTIVVEGPDIPMIRRGDKVHVKAGSLDGYYIVQSIQHSAGGSMSMALKPAVTAAPAAAGGGGGEYNVGDKVILNGRVYIDSYGNGAGKTFSGRLCTITIRVDTSRACPYHVDGIGWVYPSTITPA